MGTNKTIEIVYIATNAYCGYAKKFIDTMRYFAPGTKKILTILSTGLEEYQDYCDEDIIATNVIKIFDLYYPCINLHKPYFIKQLPKRNTDYIFYFDADTYFKEVPNYDWDYMFQRLDNNEILVTTHPYYGLIGENTWAGTNVPMKKEIQLDNLYHNLTERNDKYCDFIADYEYTYIISCFFAANRDTMHRLCDEIIRLIKMDMTIEKHYHIPYLSDENYFNALVNDYEKGTDNRFLFSVRQYNEMENTNSKEDEHVFIVQKNFIKDFKQAKR